MQLQLVVTQLRIPNPHESPIFLKVFQIDLKIAMIVEHLWLVGWLLMDAKPCGSVTTRWRSRYWLQKRRWEAPLELGGKVGEIHKGKSAESKKNQQRTFFFFWDLFGASLGGNEVFEHTFWFWGEVVRRCVSWKGVLPRRNWKVCAEK